MKTLIVVFTPLQYLNAKKYIEHYNLKDIKFLFLGINKNNIASQKGINDMSIKIVLNNSSLINDFIQQLFVSIYYVFFVKVRLYNTVVIGNYNSIFGFKLALDAQKKNIPVVLLDDGFATVNIFNTRNIDNNLTRSYRGIKQRVLKNILGLTNSDYVKEVTFFTRFNLANSRDKVIIFKSKKNDLKNFDNKICYFIGQPLVDIEYFSKSEYLHLLSKINLFFKKKDLKLIYVYHRLEKELDLDIPTVRLDLPIESYMKNADIVPRYISGFYSTALFNINREFNGVQISYFDIVNLISNDNNILNNVYKVLSIEEGITKNEL